MLLKNPNNLAKKEKISLDEWMMIMKKNLYIVILVGLLLIMGGCCIMVIVPPSKPTQLNAVAISSTEIKLTWQDNSNNEEGFKIERKTEVEEWSQIINGRKKCHGICRLRVKT